MTLYPAILSDSPVLIAQQLATVQSVPELETVQVDIIDGWFADNLTVTPVDLVDQDFGELRLDLHLMVEEPLDYVYEAREWKQELPVRSVIAQVERLSHQEDYLREVRGHDWKAGLSLNLFTPVSAIDEASWEFIDCVQIMGIEAGFQGQEFHPHALETLRATARKIASTDREIEVIVDGGVKLETLTALRERGVDGIAVGSALWNAPDFSVAVAQFQEA